MRFLLCTIVALLFTSSTFAQEVHRARIYIDSQEDMKRLLMLGLPVDHGIKKLNTFVESDFNEGQLFLAEENGFTTQIIKRNITEYYVNQNDPNHKDYVPFVSQRNADCSGATSTPTYNTPANFNVWPASSFGGFYTYSQVLQELADMSTLYPNLITVAADILDENNNPYLTNGQTDNGTTPSIGNNPIKWIKISDNPNTSNEGEPKVLYTSIHHAREPASLSQLLFYMWYLLENYDSDSEIQSIVDNTELYFIPVVNPDGYLYNELTNPNGGGFWRKNRFNGFGVDNNRNYNYFINGDSSNGVWGGSGSSGNMGSDIYRGAAPFSEVENQAVKRFVEIHDFEIALNNHTFGELIYYPFGYNGSATPDDIVYQNITGEMVKFNGYNALRDGDFSGESDDFMYGTVGTHNSIFAMTPEIGNSFWPAQNSIEGICQDMMFTNITAAQLAGNLATVEDKGSTFVSSIISDISYTLQRIGLSDPSSFTVSINPISSNISNVGASNSHNNVSYGQQINDVISLTLNSGIEVGDQISYEIVWNNGLYDKSILVEKFFGLPEIVLDEMGNTTTTNWENTDWETTTEESVSASTSITDSANSNYGPNENNSIVLSNPINLTNVLAANVTFFAKWDIENNWDYVQFDVSIDNGNTWIPQCGNFTNEGVANQASANGEPLYDGIQNDWVQETIDLIDYLNESIIFRFRLVSDTVVQEDGFYFDDLQVNVLENNLSVDSNKLNAFKIFPNPTNDVIFIQSNFNQFDAHIFNIQGQAILQKSNLNNNDTIDLSFLSNGVYFVQIHAENQSKVFKIVKQ